ncbi:MAG TPA: dihydrofolate reductase family protein [Kofleriaceae bacterium]|nr:dihydrofolate reductase family protein [Kofleriaceae bacterium]
MRKLLVHEFITIDGIIQAPGGPDEDTDGGFTRGGWTRAYWHDDIGASFGALMQEVDAFLLGRKTYVGHAQAFEPMPPGDPFGDLMNTPAKYVVSRTLEKPLWRDTTIIRDDVVPSIRALKAKPGKTIACDGSSQLVHTLFEHDLIDELFLHVYPIALGRGKRAFPADRGLDHKYQLVSAKPYPTGVVGLRYLRTAGTGS